jgi:hypothetical protein
MEVSGQLHGSVTLTPGKPWDRKLSGQQNRPGCCGEMKNFLPVSGIEPTFLGFRALSILAYRPKLVSTVKKLKVFLCLSN